METTSVLPNRIKIKGCHCSKFTNGFYVTFHVRMCDIIANANRAQLNISDEMINEWRALVNQALVKAPKLEVLAITRELAEIDRKRKKLITYLFEIVRTHCVSTISNLADSAHSLEVIVRKFSGLQKQSREHKNAMIRSMVQAFREKAADMAMLGITEVVDDLERVNDEYGAMEIRRVDRRHDYTATYKIRPKLDEIYSVAMQHVTAAYVFAKTDEEKRSILELVAKINHYISDFRRTYNESMAQKKRPRKKADNQETLEDYSDEMPEVEQDSDAPKSDDAIAENDVADVVM